MISNFVVVRFSLRIRDWHTRAYGDEANREGWFAYRSRLFNAGLLQSLARQTVPPVNVWLLMDQTDLTLYHRYIDRNHTVLTPIFASPDQPAMDQVKAAILDLPQGPMTLSRIDSDDLICDTYFDGINQAVRASGARTFDFIQVPNGFITDMRRIKKVRQENGPFLTLYTQGYQGQNIFEYRHKDIPVERTLLAEGPSWIQIAHGSNLENRLAGWTRPVAKHWPAGFHRPDMPLPPSRMQRLLARLTGRKP